MAVYDLEGIFIEANDAMVAWSRLSREELAEVSFSDLLGSADRPQVLIELDEARAGATRRFTTAGILRGDVAYRAHVTLFPVREAEVPRAVVAIVHDLARGAPQSLDLAATDAQAVAQAALLDIAHDAVYVRGLDNVISYCNLAAGEVFGFGADEVIGVDARTLADDAEAWDLATARALEDGRWSGRLEQRTRDGRMVTLDCRWTVVRDDAGRPQSILAVDSDITASRKLDEQLLRAQRMDSLGTLASGIAHDLNNVLTPILLSTQVLLATETDARRTELLTTIESGTRRGAAMLAQILTFGRGVEGRRAPVDIAQLLTSVEKFCLALLPPNIRLSVEASSDVWAPIGDETQLFQVLINLVINARDAMPNGGDVNVRAKNVTAAPSAAANALAPGRYVLVEVEDTGSGMSNETISKVFEPFFTTKPAGEGTGLGLSTSIEIVRGHGGQLQVYSEPGNGSRFMLQLPVDDTVPFVEPSAVRPLAVTTTELPGRGRVVLVVDDEAAIRTAARHALEGSGYITAAAGNGAEALKYIESVGGSVDVVITDVTMPIMDGGALIQRLRTEYPHIPIVAASGLAANSRVVDGWPPPTVTFIDKPYERSDLLRAVHDAIEPDDVGAPADG